VTLSRRPRTLSAFEPLVLPSRPPSEGLIKVAEHLNALRSIEPPVVIQPAPTTGLVDLAKSDGFTSAFSATLTTPAIVPEQLIDHPSDDTIRDSSVKKGTQVGV
jgi:hypothetical protein